MADNTVYTFGCDTAVLSAYLPQVGVGPSKALDAAAVGLIIRNNAAAVCGALRAGGFDPGVIDADTAGEWYGIAQRLVVYLTLPELIQAVNPGAREIVESRYKHALAELERLRRAPAQLGHPARERGPATRLLDGRASTTTPRYRT